MSLESGSRNSQAQPTTTAILFPLLDAVEAVENTLEKLGGDAHTLVSDAQAYFNIVALELDSYSSAGGGICDCVVEQGI
jgi:hypothetical protein